MTTPCEKKSIRVCSIYIFARLKKGKVKKLEFSRFCPTLIRILLLGIWIFLSTGSCFAHQEHRNLSNQNKLPKRAGLTLSSGTQKCSDGGSQLSFVTAYPQIVNCFDHIEQADNCDDNWNPDFTNAPSRITPVIHTVALQLPKSFQIRTAIRLYILYQSLKIFLL